MKKTILLPFLLSVIMMTSISLSAQRYYPTLDTYIQQNTAAEIKDSLDGSLFKLECRMSGAVSRVTFIEFNIGAYNKQCTKAEVNLYCYETANATTADAATWYKFDIKSLVNKVALTNL